MRVFCAEHRKSFSVPRRNPIRCENRGHVLGELDFRGQASEAVEVCWEYCCNCEHFWPSDIAHEQCPVCDRQILTRYLCARCYTFSLESPTPAAVKNFTLTAEGTPHPACPGCLQETPAEVPLCEHQCEYLGVSFTTTFRSCPVCRDLIAGTPSFPISNAEYLRQVKNQKNVRLDYEKDMLVEAEDGEFVLIPHGSGPNHPILLPKLVQFTAREDFYESYQDYYHCLSPSEGEVIIIRPATVQTLAAGWKLQEAGVLEVERQLANRQQKVSPREPVAREVRSIVTAEVKSKCFSCGAAIEREHLLEWGFCWNCGERLASGKDSSPKVRDENTLVPSQVRETPVAHAAPSSFRLSILEPAAPQPDSSLGKVKSGKLALALIGLFGLVVIGSVVWIALSRSQPEPMNDAAAQSTATASTPAHTSTTHAEDDELWRIRERAHHVASEPPAERLRIIEELQAAERKFSADYRFPYERAKLSIEEGVAHDVAFAALLDAAEKAMTAGKAREMLAELMADKDTYFRRPSRGHSEWNLLLEALENEDRRILRDLNTRLEKKAQH